MTTIFDVSGYFLSKAAMTHKKLQKLCYYAQSWHLANFDEPLFKNRFEAWLHGPVSPDLYYKYKDYGWCKIEKHDTLPSLPPDTAHFLDMVYEVYKDFCDFELEKLTKSEYPYRHAREGLGYYDYSRRPITWADMRDTYKQRLDLKRRLDHDQTISI